jgi:hypothetical protein
MKSNPNTTQSKELLIIPVATGAPLDFILIKRMTGIGAYHGSCSVLLLILSCSWKPFRGPVTAWVPSLAGPLFKASAKKRREGLPATHRPAPVQALDRRSSEHAWAPGDRCTAERRPPD